MRELGARDQGTVEGRPGAVNRGLRTGDRGLGGGVRGPGDQTCVDQSYLVDEMGLQ